MTDQSYIVSSQVITGFTVIALLMPNTSAATIITLPVQAAQIPTTLEVRIGALDGPNALGRVEALAADEVGRVYVLESDEQRVRVFDADGRFVRAVGRGGGGPGELEHPVGLAWGPDDNLWIIDPGNNRASVYDADGRLVDDRRLPSAFELAPWPGRFDRAGNLYHYAPSRGGDQFAYVMVKYDANMTPQDTIVPPEPPEPVQVFQNQTERWGVVRARVPYTPRLVWRLASDGRIVWAWTARYAIYRGVANGDPLFESEDQGPDVTSAEHASALEGLTRFREVGGRVDPSRIPDRKPALRTFFLDDQDRIWIMPERAEDETGRRLDWYDGTGRHQGYVELPVRLSATPIPVIRGGRLYGVERDELGVPYVVVIRISTAVRQ